MERLVGFEPNHSDSECSTLTHFSKSLANKKANLKQPYNQDVKEQVTTK